MPGNGDICYQISTHRSLRNEARSRPGDPLAVFPAHFFLHGPHFLYRGCLLDRKNVSPTDNRLRCWRSTNNPRFLYSYARSATEKKCPFPLSRGVPSIKVINAKIM